MKRSDQDPEEKNHYLQGRRSVFKHFLQECLAGLGYADDNETKQYAWILEREEAISALRRLCSRYGDNDWDESLHLADIIEKHLVDHLD